MTSELPSGRHRLTLAWPRLDRTMFWKNRASGPPKTAAADNAYPLMWVLDPQYTWRGKEIFQNEMRRGRSVSMEGGRVGEDTRNEGHRSRLGSGSSGVRSMHPKRGQGQEMLLVGGTVSAVDRQAWRTKGNPAPVTEPSPGSLVPPPCP